MRALFQWIEDRTGAWEAWRRLADRPIPGRPCVCRAWPAAILFTLLVQAVTGFVLWSHYAPNDQTAWESVYYLQYEVSGGWLLRAIHHYGGQVLLVLVAGYLLQMIIL